MTFHQAMSQIEDVSFIVRVCIASDLDTMLFLADQQEAVQAMFSHTHDGKYQTALFHRILKLADATSDDEFRNRYDVALAVYAWILRSTNPRLSLYAADAILKTPRCWWAWKAARAIMSEHEADTLPVDTNIQEHIEQRIT